MTKFKSQNFLHTFTNAKRGIFLVLKSERNLRIHFVVATLALLLAAYLEFSAIKFCLVLLTILFVILAEMINSAIEYGLDAVFHNRYSRLVGMAKDISAGAVLLSTIIAVVIGVILFLPSLASRYAHLLPVLH